MLNERLSRKGVLGIIMACGFVLCIHFVSLNFALFSRYYVCK